MSPFVKAAPCACLGLILCLSLPLQAETDEKDPDVELLKDVGLKSDNASLIAFLRGRCVEGRNAENIAALIRKMGSSRFTEREQAYKAMLPLARFAVPELHEAAASKDREIAQRAKDCLKQVHALPANDAAHASIRLLVKRRAKEAVEVLLHYLPSAENEEAEVEVWYGLEELISKQGSIPEALRQALKDREPSRRAVAACLLAWKGNKEDRVSVCKSLDDWDAFVRLRAAQGLLAVGDKTGLPALIRLLDEPEVALSWQAEELLHWAAGNTAPEATVGAASVKQRRRCQEEWENWQKKHADTLTLVPRKKEGLRPGLLLVSEVANADSGIAPRLWLRGCNATARWEWSAKSGLRDFQLILGNKLLVTGDQDLVQLDLDGKTFWQSDARMNTFSIQSNGTILGFGSEEPVTRLKEAFLVDWKGGVLEKHVADTGETGAAYFLNKLPNGRLSWFDPDLKMLRVYDLASKEYKNGAVLSYHAGYIQKCEGFVPFGQWFMCRQLKEGTPYDAMVFDAEGKLRKGRAWETCAAFTRLRNGNSVVSIWDNALGRATLPHLLVEFDSQGKRVWEDVTKQYVDQTKICLPLVRFGFDLPAEAVIDCDSVESRIKQLRHKDPIIRHFAAQMLATQKAKADTAAESIFQAMNGMDGKLWEETLSAATCGVRGPNSVPFLLKHVKDKNPKIQQWVLYGLLMHNDRPKEIVPVLLEALRDEDQTIASRAAYRANLFRSEKEVMQALTQFVDEATVTIKPEKLPVTYAALYGLSEPGPNGKEALTVLMKISKSPTHALHNSGYWHLARIARWHEESKAEVFSYFTSVLRGSDDVKFRIKAVDALNSMGVKAKPAVLGLLWAFQARDVKDPADVIQLKNRVMAALRQIGDEGKEAIPELMAALEDKALELTVRETAVVCLGKFGRSAKEAIPILAKVAEDHKQPERLRLSVVKVLLDINK